MSELEEKTEADWRGDPKSRRLTDEEVQAAVADVTRISDRGRMSFAELRVVLGGIGRTAVADSIWGVP